MTAHELSSTLPFDEKGRLKSLFFADAFNIYLEVIEGAACHGEAVGENISFEDIASPGLDDFEIQIVDERRLAFAAPGASVHTSVMRIGRATSNGATRIKCPWPSVFSACR